MSSFNEHRVKEGNEKENVESRSKQRNNVPLFLFLETFVRYFKFFLILFLRFLVVDSCYFVHYVFIFSY